MLRSLLSFGLLSAGLLLFASSAHALSVAPPTFEQMVAEAPVIVRARVAAVSSQWVESPGGRAIKTFVSFTVTKTLKGAAQSKLVLSFLGGTVGEDYWDVPGMPHFSPGDDQYLFVTNDGSVCPLTGAMHGRYRVLNSQTAKRLIITRDNATPLTSTDEVVLPLRTSPPPLRTAAEQRALTPETFERLIVKQLALIEEKDAR